MADDNTFTFAPGGPRKSWVPPPVAMPDPTPMYIGTALVIHENAPTSFTMCLQAPTYKDAYEQFETILRIKGYTKSNGVIGQFKVIPIINDSEMEIKMKFTLSL